MLLREAIVPEHLVVPEVRGLSLDSFEVAVHGFLDLPSRLEKLVFARRLAGERHHFREHRVPRYFPFLRGHRCENHEIPRPFLREQIGGRGCHQPFLFADPLVEPRAFPGAEERVEHFERRVVAVQYVRDVEAKPQVGVIDRPAVRYETKRLLRRLNG